MREPFDPACPVPLAARGFALRLSAAADETALRALYSRHRWDEFAPLGLPEAQIHGLLTMQYTIQVRQYAANYGNPRFYALDREGTVAGRLMLGEADGTLRILDILIDPALRGQGVGGTLLAGLLDQAGRAGWPVTLHVAKGNPAGRLYERLGFRVTGDVGIAFAMAWAAPATGQPAAP